MQVGPPLQTTPPANASFAGDDVVNKNLIPTYRAVGAIEKVPLILGFPASDPPHPCADAATPHESHHRLWRHASMVLSQSGR